MNRRNFLSLFSAGVAGIALEQAIPLGRVWSFPKEIVVAKHPFDFSDEYDHAMGRWLTGDGFVIVDELADPHVAAAVVEMGRRRFRTDVIHLPDRIITLEFD